jgi:hypothetical protein
MRFSRSVHLCLETWYDELSDKNAGALINVHRGILQGCVVSTDHVVDLEHTRSYLQNIVANSQISKR